LVAHIEGGTLVEGVENRVLRIFGPERDEVTGVGDSYTIRSLMTCIQYLGDQIEKNEVGWACST